MNYNIYNILIISGVLQGFLFGIVVLFGKSFRIHSNKYLAKLVLFISFNNIYYWFIDTGILTIGGIYEYLYIPWVLLILLMFYLFLRSYLQLPLARIIQRALRTPFYLFFTIHGFLLILYLFNIEFLISIEPFKINTHLGSTISNH